MSDAYILKVLEQLCNAAGVGGQQQIVNTARELLSEYTNDISLDAVGSLIATLSCDITNAPTILLEAHMDEIGFIVTAIDEKGFLKVQPCGGVDCRCLAATPVTVWTNTDTPLNGVFCSTPPHLQSEKKDTVLTNDALYIDIGLPYDEVITRVKPGTKVSFSNNFACMQEGRVTSKALDNRAGMAAVLYALQLLKNISLPCTVKVLFACGEELGCRGATPGAFSTQANVAIITDVSFAYTPDAKREECGEMGKGVMLGISPTLSYELTKKMQSIMEKHDINFQTEVVGGKTGTDADAIGIVREGIPSVLLSIPLKYMHTPVETVDICDIAAVGKSMAAFIEEGVLQK